MKRAIPIEELNIKGRGNVFVCPKKGHEDIVPGDYIMTAPHDLYIVTAIEQWEGGDRLGIFVVKYTKEK